MLCGVIYLMKSKGEYSMKFLNKKMLMALLMACVLIFSTLLTACGETDPVK